MIDFDNLDGFCFSAADESALGAKFGKFLPNWLVKICQKEKLAGCCFSLSEEDDLSEFGVEMRWMTAIEMIEEGSDLVPGCYAIKQGFFPFGMCLEGSGDPYFIKISENNSFEHSPVVRIPHDSIEDETICESDIDLVSRSLEEFFGKANF